MPEQSIRLNSEKDIELEGLLADGASDRGVVVTHPHPLYGGDMRNIVVETICRAFQTKGIHTLRFNFRGVGKSTGSYDDGKGEQADLMAAFDFLRCKGLKAIDLAGYSFGTWIIAQLADQLTTNAIMMVSPPVAMMAFDPTAAIPKLKLVITGSRDEFAPPDQVNPLVKKWNPNAAFEVIQGADHFFFGDTERLFKIILKSV